MFKLLHYVLYNHDMAFSPLGLFFRCAVHNHNCKTIVLYCKLNLLLYVAVQCTVALHLSIQSYKETSGDLSIQTPKQQELCTRVLHANSVTQTHSHIDAHAHYFTQTVCSNHNDTKQNTTETDQKRSCKK